MISEIFGEYPEVCKFIHSDGSETCIKALGDMQEPIGDSTTIIPDKNKYTIFLSDSIGCSMKCSFCHLTLLNAKSKKLTNDQIITNAQESIEYMANFHNPLIKKMYIKISWMGMGDAMLNPARIPEITRKILDWAIEEGYTIGLDGVDLSSVIPTTLKSSTIEMLNDFNTRLLGYTINPINLGRTPFRFFYSIHMLGEDIRNHHMPNISEPLYNLELLSQEAVFNIIIHQIFLDGVNDSYSEVQRLIAMMDDYPYQMRILRYNDIPNSQLKESDQLVDILNDLTDNGIKLKVQISPGKEVKAACGQFIVTQKDN